MGMPIINQVVFLIGSPLEGASGVNMGFLPKRMKWLIERNIWSFQKWQRSLGMDLKRETGLIQLQYSQMAKTFIYFFCSTKLLCNTRTKWNGRKSERWIQPLSPEEFNNMLNSRTFPNLLDHYNSVLQTSNLRHSTGKRITDSLGCFSSALPTVRFRERIS